VQPIDQKSILPSIPRRSFSSDVSLLPPLPLTDPRLPAADLREAAAWIQALPYGRTGSRTDLSAVITEGRGTCSSKHALLSSPLLCSLARDAGAEGIDLVIGIYAMSAQTNPAVAPVLEAAGLDWLPEAHCYLRCGSDRLDITTPAARPLPVLYEEAIIPEQSGAYKMALHRGFLAAWSGQADITALWSVRERCIAALSAR
jgi:hypothetical protein